MKKFVIGLLLLTTHYIQAQTAYPVSQLATLGKVWGFLKYYHPSAMKGNPDWDMELIRMIPLAENSVSVLALDSLLNSWYRSLPTAKLASQPVSRTADRLERNFSEINIQRFPVSDWLKNELLQLYNYHLPDTSRYVTRFFNNYYFDHIIHTEDSHSTPAYPERGMRLLALFRYWNTIEYFYPHKNRAAPWDNVLTNYIQPFLNAKDSVQYRYAIRKLIHELPDSHSFMQEPGDRYYFYPFRLDYIDGKYLVGQVDDSIAIKWDYKLGDEIIAVNGKPVQQREQELLSITAGTNQLSVYRNIAQELLKDGDSIVNVKFKRGKKLIDKQLTLHSWPVYSQLKRSPDKPLWQEMEKGIWYVRFCRITNPDTLQHLFQQIRDAKAVIWEMRDYPNYKVTVKLNEYLFNRTTRLTEEKNPSDLFPGLFIKSPLYFNPSIDSDHAVFDRPMIVLVDEHTQSLAESIAAVLKLRPNTITMGRQTAGTTGNITWFSLPGGIEVSYTGVGVTGTNNGFGQGEGVKLDFPIRLTKKTISKHKDYILEQAIKAARKM